MDTPTLPPSYPDRHFLQSSHWRTFERSLGKRTITGEGDGYSFLAITERTPVGEYLYLPYGPYLKHPDALGPAIRHLKSSAGRALFIRIEPTLHLAPELLHSFGAIKSKDLNPAETWVLTLPADRTMLLSQLPRRTRGYYNTHEKKGITITQSHTPDDIRHLTVLQNQIFAKKRIKPFPESYLRAELAQDFATLYLAWFEGKVIAAILVFDDENTRFYMQAASDKAYAKLNANGILTIASILDAATAGLKYYDFWGIAPAGAPADHPWAGFTAFKKSFAGQEVDYTGTYDIPLGRAKYRLYRLLKSIKGRL